MELITTILIATACGYGGAYLAERRVKRGARISADTQANAYKDLLHALLRYEIACSEAAIAAMDDGVTDDMKRAVSEAGNGIIRMQNCIGFMLPAEIVVATEAAISNTFGKEWGERLEAVRAARQNVSNFARKDVQMASS